MKRVLTAAVLAPTVLYAVLGNHEWLFYAVITIVAALCYVEYCGIAGILRNEIIAGVVAGTALLFATGQSAILLLILLPLLAVAMAMRMRDPANVLPDTAAQTFGFLYIYGGWKTAVFLHSISPYWLTFGLLVNWIGDTGAYYVGRNFGRHKLAPIVSPGKTWEGAAGSVFASLLLGLFVLPRFVTIDLPKAALITIVANIAGQVGDLAESAIKRGAGVKDSGALLPGHGGMLDRVDSSLFSLPILYGVLYFTGM
jgi:phosphatidate cytidylyltransferase